MPIIFFVNLAQSSMQSSHDILKRFPPAILYRFQTKLDFERPRNTETGIPADSRLQTWAMEKFLADRTNAPTTSCRKIIPLQQFHGTEGFAPFLTRFIGIADQ